MRLADRRDCFLRSPGTVRIGNAYAEHRHVALELSEDLSGLSESVRGLDLVDQGLRIDLEAVRSI